MKSRSELGDRGFTIIELMIATAVLSTLLVMVTLIMISISNLYYKGINQSRVQDATRGITDEITRQIQLNDRPAIGPLSGPNNTQTYCVGTARYTFILGVEIGKPAKGGTPAIYQHILWRDVNPTPGTCPQYVDAAHPTVNVDLTDSHLADTDPGGAELISPNSRLTAFSISGVMPGNLSPYTLSIGLAYGDNDLLCNPSVNLSGKNSCATTDEMLQRVNYTDNVLCKGKIGQQFCSTAKLDTSVTQRL